MGKPIWAQPTDIRTHPTINNRGAVADSANKGVIRVLSGRHYLGAVVVRRLRFAHPRLNPRYRSVRVLSGRLSQLLSYMSHRKGRERQAKGVVGLLIIHYVPIATNVRTGREPGGECRRDLAVGKPIWAQPAVCDAPHHHSVRTGREFPLL